MEQGPENKKKKEINIDINKFEAALDSGRVKITRVQPGAEPENRENGGNIAVENKPSAVDQYTDALKSSAKGLDNNAIDELSDSLVAFSLEMSKKMEAEKNTFLEKTFALINSDKQNEKVSFKRVTDETDYQTPEQCLAQLYVNAKKLDEPYRQAIGLPEEEGQTAYTNYYENKKAAFENIMKAIEAFNYRFEGYNIEQQEYNTDEYRIFQNGKDLIDDAEQFVKECKRTAYDPTKRSDHDLQNAMDAYAESQERVAEEVENYIENHADKVYDFKRTPEEANLQSGADYSVNFDEDITVGKVVSDPGLFVSNLAAKKGEILKADMILEEIEETKKKAETAYSAAESRLNEQSEKDKNDLIDAYEQSIADVEARYKQQSDRYSALQTKFRKVKPEETEEFIRFKQGIENLKKADLTKISPELAYIKPDQKETEVFKADDAEFYNTKSAETTAKINEMRTQKAKNSAAVKEIDDKLEVLRAEKTDKTVEEAIVNYSVEIHDINEKLQVLESGLESRKKGGLDYIDVFTDKADYSQFPQIGAIIENSYVKATAVINARSDFGDSLTDASFQTLENISKAQEKFAAFAADPKYKRNFGNIDTFYVQNFDSRINELKQKGVSAPADFEKLNFDMVKFCEGLQSLARHLSENPKPTRQEKADLKEIQKFTKDISENLDRLSPVNKNAAEVSMAKKEYNSDLDVIFALMEQEKKALSAQKTTYEKLAEESLKRVKDAEEAKSKAAKDLKVKSELMEALNAQRNALTEEGNRIDANAAYLTALKDVFEKGKTWYTSRVLAESKEMENLRTVMTEKQNTLSNMASEHEKAMRDLDARTEASRSEFKKESQIVRNYCKKTAAVAKELKENTAGISGALATMKNNAITYARSKEIYTAEAKAKLQADTREYNKTVKALEAQQKKQLDAVMRSGKKFGKDSPLFNEVKEKINTYKRITETFNRPEDKNSAQYKDARKDLEKALSDYITQRDHGTNKHTPQGQQRLDAVKSLYNNFQRQKTVEENFKNKARDVQESLLPVEPHTLLEANMLKKANFMEKNVLLDQKKLDEHIENMKTSLKETVEALRKQEREEELEEQNEINTSMSARKKDPVSVKEPELGLGH